MPSFAGHQQTQPNHYILHNSRTDIPWITSLVSVGVHLDTHLNFNNHVDSITKKANSIRGFLGRNLSHCSRKLKEAAYTTFVRPTVEYASTTWDLYTQRNVCKLEQVQRSSAHFVTGDFSQKSIVSAMLQNLKWPSFQSRLAMFFKIHHNLVDIN